MSVIESREVLLSAMHRGVSPTIPAIEDFIDEVNDFLTTVNDYDEWNANKATTIYDHDHSPEVIHEPAITVAKLRNMLGYGKEGKA